MRQNDFIKMLKIKGIMMTSISDSLIFSISVKERGAMNKLTKLISGFVQSLLLQYGLLLRGGIAVGKLYHDGEIVYGPGLVKAYELESKLAIYPRIIMDSSDFEVSILSCTNISRSVLREGFISTEDGFLMWDCLRYTEQHQLVLCRSKLEKIKTLEIKAQQKINWMISIINGKLD